MSNRLITREEIAEWERTGRAAWIDEAPRHCPLMPAQAHCWHEPEGYWDSPFPPPLLCCWCGAEGGESAVPLRHGPYAVAEVAVR